MTSTRWSTRSRRTSESSLSHAGNMSHSGQHHHLSLLLLYCSWMVGRFIRDRNDLIWHKQANLSHHRHGKSSGRMTRLKRLKPLSPAYTHKFLKLGFK